MTFVVDRDADLSLEREASRLQLDAQCCFANRFRQPWPEHAMNLDRATNHLFREIGVSIKHDESPPRPRVSAIRGHVKTVESSCRRVSNSVRNERKGSQDVLEFARPQLIRMRTEGLQLRVLLHFIDRLRPSRERSAVGA